MVRVCSKGKWLGFRVDYRVKKAVAIYKPVDLEIRKLINTPPVT